MKIMKYGSLCESRKAALDEAASIGGAVIPIRAIERTSDEVVLIGSMDLEYADHINSLPVQRTMLSGFSISNFYIPSFDGRMRADNPLGHLVIQRPLTISGAQIQTDCKEAKVAIVLDDYDGGFLSLITEVRCCKRCNSVIPRRRVEAIKGAKLCVNCQKLYEGGMHERRSYWAYQDAVM